MELLNDMALFVEVAHARSFRGAADVTGVPNSTLSRRISALEKAIGLRLLHRTTRKVELTEAGQLYYERSRRIRRTASGPPPPSARIPQFDWKSATARAARGPSMPSTRPESKARRAKRVCRSATSSPRR